MIPRLRKKLTYSNVLATLALFVALGGVAVAAGLPNNSVGAHKLKNGAVTTKKLRKQAVTAPKIAPGAVSGSKLAGGAVGAGALASGAVTGSKLANGAVTAAKLANDAVTNSKIANGVVGTNKLGNEVVTTEKLKNGSVTPAKLSAEVTRAGRQPADRPDPARAVRGRRRRRPGAVDGSVLRLPARRRAQIRSDRPADGDHGQLPGNHRRDGTESPGGGGLPLPLRDQQGEPGGRQTDRRRASP